VLVLERRHVLGGAAVALSGWAKFASLLVVTRDGHTGTGWASLGIHRLGINRWPIAILVPTAVVGGAYVIVDVQLQMALDLGLKIAVADGLGLPYPDGSFDIAHTSLVVHHLGPGDAVVLLREMLRVARSGIVVNDLDRSWPTWLGAWLLAHTVARSRYTRHDGPLSVRRAYTRDEMTDLIREAGGTPIASIVGFAHHRYAIAAR